MALLKIVHYGRLDGRPELVQSATVLNSDSENSRHARCPFYSDNGLVDLFDSQYYDVK